MSYQDWVGRTQHSTETFGESHNMRLAAIGDYSEVPWDHLAPLGHWTGFTPSDKQSDIGTDGHPRRGGFLPPVDLPRRMWASGAIRFHRPIPLGVMVDRVSTISEVTTKNGKSGRLVFVVVDHRLSVNGSAVLSETQNIVYKDGDPTLTARGGTTSPDFSRTVVPDPVLLFRYSAATFNAHRIHYDRDYAIATEGYPDIVVQGPLSATLLLDAAARYRSDPVATFAFRGRAPLFSGSALSLNIFDRPGGLALEAVDADGRLGMTAEVDFA